MEQRDRDHARHIAKESGDTLVFLIRNDSQCGKCTTALPGGSMLTISGDLGLCLPCAGLADLEFLPSGDAALTRRAGKLSTRKAIVLRWARSRKRYERQGTLLEPASIIAAGQQCAADADERAAKNAKSAIKREAADLVYQQQFLAELRRLFPGCPEAEAAEISKHACEKHSGRVGRSAAAKELDAEMIRLAVVAHIRHIHTGYDQLIEEVGKSEARRLIQAKIGRVLASWESRAVSR